MVGISQRTALLYRPFFHLFISPALQQNLQEERKLSTRCWITVTCNLWCCWSSYLPKWQKTTFYRNWTLIPLLIFFWYWQEIKKFLISVSSTSDHIFQNAKWISLNKCLPLKWVVDVLFNSFINCIYGMKLHIVIYIYYIYFIIP